MIAHVLEALRPRAGVRGRRRAARGGGRTRVWGSGEWMVVEADESDRSFLRLAPEVAVVTNIELDHHTTYASGWTTSSGRSTQFLERVPEDGTAVVWDELPVRAPPGARACRYGLDAAAPTLRRARRRGPTGAAASSPSCVDGRGGRRGCGCPCPASTTC